MTESIIEAKQDRSIATQNRLIAALHNNLKTKYFEHISIKELASEANVSVGTFYRRFKNKDALLPLLYQDFGNRMQAWVEELEKVNFANLQTAITQTCEQAHVFLLENKGVFRTLHLNTRLHSEILKSDSKVDRAEIYQRISQVFIKAAQNQGRTISTTVASTSVFTMIALLMEKTIYPDMTPATASELNSEEFAAELPNLLIAYLNQ